MRFELSSIKVNDAPKLEFAEQFLGVRIDHVVYIEPQESSSQIPRKRLVF